MSESFWKKEIHLSRRPKDEQADVDADEFGPGTAEAKPSFWKKEIGRPRKPRAEPEQVEVAVAGSGAAEAKPSFWKKEIGRPRKPRAEPEQVEVAVEEPGSEAAEAKPSFWKKEISLSRKQESGQEVDPEPEDEREAESGAAEAKPSFWKKEISLSRKQKSGQELEPDPEPDPEDEREAAPGAAEAKPSFWKQEISLSRKRKSGQELEPEPDPEPEGGPSAAIAAVLEPWADRRPRDPDAVSHTEAEQPPPPPSVELAPEAPAAELDSTVADTTPGAPQADPGAPQAEQPAPVPTAEPAAVEPGSVEPGSVEPVVLEPGVLPPPQPVAGDATPSQQSVVSEPAAPEPAAPEPATPEPATPRPAAQEAAVEPPPTVPMSAEPVPDEPVPAPPADAEPVRAAPVPVEPGPAEPEPELVPLVPMPVVPPPVAGMEASAASEPRPRTEPEPESSPAVAELPPEPSSPVEPVVVQPPADELPPLDDEKTAFWKKEIRFSRKPKSAKPAKPRKEKKEKKAAKRSRPEQPEAPEGDARPRRSLGLRAPSLGLRSHRAKRIVGLEIGSSQLAAARVSNNGVAELQQLARAPLASGVVVGGELRDPDALAAALKSFFSANRLPRKGVRLGIASNRIGVRIFEIAGVDDEKQLGNAVRFRAQEALPIPLDEAALDYRVLDESVDSEGRPVRRVLLVVAHKELIDRYVSACKRAGVALSAIDLEAFALLRSLAPPSDREGSALVAVSVGHERTTLAVSDGRVCEFTRVLDWGGSTLNVALARVLNSTPSEVETLKRSLSLAGGPMPDGLSPEHAAAAIEAVRRAVETLARDLIASLQFYQGQPGSLGIAEIVITGGTAQLDGLAEELERLIGVRVRVGNPLGRLKVSKRVTAPEPGTLAVAIGLGIED